MGKLAEDRQKGTGTRRKTPLGSAGWRTEWPGHSEDDSSIADGSKKIAQEGVREASLVVLGS